MVKTDKLWIGSMVPRTDEAAEMAEAFAGEVGAVGADLLRMRLLTEETLGMARTLLRHFEGEFWLEGDREGYKIILEADVREREESASPAQPAPIGFMAKIAEMLNCAYVFEDASEMPDRLAETLPDYIRCGMREKGDSRIWAGEWSLSAYRQTVDARKKEAPESFVLLDELEKSIVAQIADEVTVGIYGRKLRMAVCKRLA